MNMRTIIWLNESGLSRVFVGSSNAQSRGIKEYWTDDNDGNDGIDNLSSVEC